jgi:hypothetical protein
MLNGRLRVIDCSDFTLAQVVSVQAEAWLTRWRPTRLLHPDLWHDGRWEQ